MKKLIATVLLNCVTFGSLALTMPTKASALNTDIQFANPLNSSSTTVPSDSKSELNLSESTQK
jgi:hypothetical protein